MGNGPVGEKPAAAAELLPPAILAPAAPPLTTPADSMGTATTPKAAWPEAAIPSETALLACVLAVLAFCALSAALAVGPPSELQITGHAIKVMMDFRDFIGHFLNYLCMCTSQAIGCTGDGLRC